MPWCPECKGEYEVGVSECAECHIPLVEDREKAIAMRPLIKVREEELDEVLDYLAYSKIDPVKVSTEEGSCVISVTEFQIEEASRYIKVYVKEHMTDEHNEEDYYYNAYEVDSIDVADKTQELKSTYYTFVGVGILLVVVALLNALDIVTISMFSKLVFTLGAGGIGVAFIAVGVHTKSQIDEVLKRSEGKEDLVKTMVDYFVSNQSRLLLDERSELEGLEAKKEALDEGAQYFELYDKIKAALNDKYTDVEDSLLNAATEIIIESMDTRV